MVNFEVLVVGNQYAIALEIEGKPFTKVVDRFVEVEPDTVVIWYNPDTHVLEEAPVDFSPLTGQQVIDPVTKSFDFIRPPDYLVQNDYYKRLTFMPIYAEACWHWYQAQVKMAEANEAYQAHQLNRYPSKKVKPDDHQDSVP